MINMDHLAEKKAWIMVNMDHVTTKNAWKHVKYGPYKHLLFLFCLSDKFICHKYKNTLQGFLTLQLLWSKSDL